MVSTVLGLGHRLQGKVLLIILLGLVSCCACSSLRTQILDGQAIFDNNCSSCHTVGGGDLAGPDLKGVTDKQSQEWLISFIADPNGIISSGDPTAANLLKKYNYLVMPDFGLTNGQIEAVLAYLKAQSGVVIQAIPSVTPGGLLQGNPANGKAIFLGEVHLENGGPFCIGCHNIDDTGILGGGTLGPNLTNAYTKYGDTGLEAILSNLPFLTMRPIFNTHPPTVNERADLRAFIKSQAGKPEVNKEPLVIGISLAGLLISMIFIGLVWRNRLQGVRKQLLRQTRANKRPNE